MFINDEHNNDNSAIGTLIAALFTSEIKAASLFKPSIDLHAPPRSTKRPTGSSKSRAHKESAALHALEDDEDDTPISEIQAKEKLRIMLTTVVRDTFRSEVVARILGGNKKLAEAVHEKDQPVLEGFAQLVSTTFGVSVQWKDIRNHTFIGLMRDVWHLSTKKVKPRAHKESAALHALDVCLDCDKNECECSDVLERPKKKAVKIKKEAKPVKIKTYDNSHNWGPAGRIAQRSIDADSKTKTPMPECAGCGSSSCTDPDCEW